MRNIALLAMTEFHLILGTWQATSLVSSASSIYLFLPVNNTSDRRMLIFQSSPSRPTARPWAVTWATAPPWRTAGGRNWYQSAPAGTTTPASPRLYRKVERGFRSLNSHLLSYSLRSGDGCEEMWAEWELWAQWALLVAGRMW